MHFRLNTVDLNIHELYHSDSLMNLIVSDCQAAFMDLTVAFYLFELDKSALISFLLKLESKLQKTQYPVFAFLRHDILGNDLLYNFSKAVIISESNHSNSFSEERFAESSCNYPVSILTRPGSGKLELNDQFEFNIQDGFKIKINSITKKEAYISSSSHYSMPISTFNLDSKKDQPDSTNAKILVEDSDRDSDDEMEADSNF